MFASFGSPAHSTLLHALRKGYLSTLSLFTSVLFSKHIPNTVATVMGHLDHRRQGLDYTSPTPVVVPLTPAPAAIPQSIPNDPPPYDKCIDIFNEFDDEVLAME